MSKKIGFRTQFGAIVPLRPDQLLEIRQDKKYEKLCHIKTTIKNHKGKHVWFSIKHTAKEILELYYKFR